MLKTLLTFKGQPLLADDDLQLLFQELLASKDSDTSDDLAIKVFFIKISARLALLIPDDLPLSEAWVELRDALLTMNETLHIGFENSLAALHEEANLMVLFYRFADNADFSRDKPKTLEDLLRVSKLYLPDLEDTVRARLIYANPMSQKFLKILASSESKWEIYGGLVKKFRNLFCLTDLLHIPEFAEIWVMWNLIKS